MKAITVMQPWAALIVIGAKTMETRPVSTDYRGPLAIHAAKTAARTKDPYLLKVLAQAGLRPEDLPLGCVVATCILIDCQKILPANCPCYPEYAWGDFRPGYYAWHLSHIQKIEKPVAARGGPGLWDWDSGLEPN